jgi:uncharacterized protein (TIGR04255 family)
MQRTYKNPPIEEALVEVQFSAVDWDVTMPGRLHEKLKGDYTAKPRQQKITTANVVLGASEQLPTLSTFEGFGKSLFPNEDGTRLVGVGQNLVSIHSLRPYEGWQAFRPRVEQGFDA